MCCVEKEIIEQLCVWVSVGLYMYVLLDQQVHVCLLLFFFFENFLFCFSFLVPFCLFVCLFCYVLFPFFFLLSNEIGVFESESIFFFCLSLFSLRSTRMYTSWNAHCI